MYRYIGASAGQNAINSEDLEHFRANGGNVLFAPEYDYVKYEDQTVFKLRIQASDFVVPICHEGMNRSQVCRK